MAIGGLLLSIPWTRSSDANLDFPLFYMIFYPDKALTFKNAVKSQMHVWVKVIEANRIE